MPIYEYVCTACGERFEIQRKFSDPPITTCAEFSCPKGEPVEKVISAPAIMFKGSGWYVTDYSDKLKEPKRPGEDGKPQGASSDTSEGKTEKAASSSSGGGESSGTATNTGGTSSSPSSGSSSTSGTSGGTASSSGSSSTSSGTSSGSSGSTSSPS